MPSDSSTGAGIQESSDPESTSTPPTPQHGPTPDRFSSSMSMRKVPIASVMLNARLGNVPSFARAPDHSTAGLASGKASDELCGRGAGEARRESAEVAVIEP